MATGFSSAQDISGPALNTRVDQTNKLLRRRLLLYTAYATILALVIIGAVTSLWLWQVKDWGISIDWDGRILSVQAGSRAAEAGVLAGDSISFADSQELKQLSGQVQEGALYSLAVTRNGQLRTVTLEAHPSTLGRRLDLSVNAWVGVGFVLLGVAPLIARRRDFTLWMFFVATEMIGLFLITVTPRSLHVFWAELAAYVTLAIFPAVLFHFHTLFPQRKLGTKRQSIVFVVYACALAILPFNLSGIWDYAFYVSDLWAFVIQLYLAGILLSCLVMLIHTYRRTQDRRVRGQLKVITICSAIGLAINGLLLLPSLSFNLELVNQLENLAVISALTTPFGYAYSMLRYDLLIDGFLWRRWLLRAALSSILFIGALAIGIALIENSASDTGTAIVLWVLAALGAVMIGVLHTLLGEWLEGRLFKGSSYVDLLDYATRELASFQSLDEYVRFFTEELPTRLKISCSLIFLPQGKSGRLTLRGYSPSLHSIISLNGTPQLAAGSDLHVAMQSAPTLVPLSTFLLAQGPSFSADDARFLQTLQTLQIELLMPLVSRQQGRLIGLVALASKETDETFSPQETTALSALARTASTSAENVLLFEELQQQLADLREEREYRIELTRHANAVQDQERKRIAREIHDSPLQELGVATRALTTMREIVQALLVRCEDLVMEAEANHSVVNSAAWSRFMPLLNELQIRLGQLLGEDVSLVAELPAADNNTSRDGCLLTASAPVLETQPTVEGIISEVKLAVQHIRDICNDLHPTFLDDPLCKTLDRSARVFEARYPGVSIRFHESGSEPSTLPEDIKVACKQIMEQAVYNAIVHARPTQVYITVIFGHAGEITMSVVDDGVGFEPRSPRQLRASGHHGLADMEDRADLTGGKLRILSAPGQGTSVTLYIPPQPSMDIMAVQQTDVVQLLPSDSIYDVAYPMARHTAS